MALTWRVRRIPLLPYERRASPSAGCCSCFGCGFASAWECRIGTQALHMPPISDERIYEQQIWLACHHDPPSIRGHIDTNDVAIACSAVFAILPTVLNSRISPSPLATVSLPDAIFVTPENFFFVVYCFRSTIAFPVFHAHAQGQCPPSQKRIYTVKPSLQVSPNQK